MHKPSHPWIVRGACVRHKESGETAWISCTYWCNGEIEVVDIISEEGVRFSFLVGTILDQFDPTERRTPEPPWEM